MRNQGKMGEMVVKIGVFVGAFVTVTKTLTCINATFTTVEYVNECGPMNVLRSPGLRMQPGMVTRVVHGHLS